MEHCARRRALASLCPRPGGAAEGEGARPQHCVLGHPASRPACRRVLVVLSGMSSEEQLADNLAAAMSPFQPLTKSEQNARSPGPCASTSGPSASPCRYGLPVGVDIPGLFKAYNRSPGFGHPRRRRRPPAAPAACSTIVGDGKSRCAAGRKKPHADELHEAKSRGKPRAAARGRRPAAPAKQRRGRAAGGGQGRLSRRAWWACGSQLLRTPDEVDVAGKKPRSGRCRPMFISVFRIRLLAWSTEVHLRS